VDGGALRLLGEPVAHGRRQARRITGIGASE
jgi:hypothetical protein